MGNNDLEILANFYNDVDVTASDRFNAARRLRRMDFHSIASISLASFSLIVVSILTISTGYEINNEIKGALNFVQLITPIALLMVSIACGVANYGSQAEKMHACGLEINKLRRDVNATPVDKRIAKIKYFLDRYSNILDKYENHENVDHSETKRVREAKKIKKENCNAVKRFFSLFPLRITSILCRNGLNIYVYITLSLLSILWTIFVLFNVCPK